MKEPSFQGAASLSEVLRVDLNQHFLINKQNLHNFLLQASHIKDMPINMKIFKSYFKVPFEVFPESNEIMDIFSKIIQRIVLTKTQTRNWYYEDVVLLIWIVVRYCFMKLLDFRKLTQKDWAIISSMIPSKTADLCKFKWLSITKINLQEIPWTEEEDETLREMLRDHSEVKWSEIAKELYYRTNEMIFRTGKLCRERWNNYLDPHLKKGTWTLEEDISLLRLVKETGKKWSEISRKMKGRTENAVKNRYNSVMKKEKKKIKVNTLQESFNSNTSLPSEDLENEIMKLLIGKKEKSVHKRSMGDQMELESNENIIENESICSDSSKNRKDKRKMVREKNVFHLCDLEIEKKGNILFELLKFDFEEEKNTTGQSALLSNNMMHSFGMNFPNMRNQPGSFQNQGNPFSTIIPAMNTAQSIEFGGNPSIVDLPRGASNPNITTNVPPTQTMPANTFKSSVFNPLTGNTNPTINQNNLANFQSINSITPSNFMNKAPLNQFPAANFQGRPANQGFNSNTPFNDPFADPLMNQSMLDSTRNQLNHYYMQKNMELFEQFLLSNNSNVNNYHNFQNLQKMQKAFSQTPNYNPSFSSFGNFQNPQFNPPFFQGGNEAQAQGLAQGPAFQPQPQPNSDPMKYEEKQGQAQPDQVNIKFPSFILPNNPPVLMNPMLQKIKFEEHPMNNTSSNTSNDSYRSLASSLNTFGSLSSMSNLSEPSPGFNALNFLLSNQQQINNPNQAAFQNKAPQKPQDNPNSQNFPNNNFNQDLNTQLSNFAVKDISQFNILEQNQSQLQFAIINAHKQEIYVCGNLNNIKKNEAKAAKNMRKTPSPRNRKRTTMTNADCGTSPRSPSKFQDLSPRNQRQGFADWANRD